MTKLTVVTRAHRLPKPLSCFHTPPPIKYCTHEIHSQAGTSRLERGLHCYPLGLEYGFHRTL
jgi:hypothetical protein